MAKIIKVEIKQINKIKQKNWKVSFNWYSHKVLMRGKFLAKMHSLEKQKWVAFRLRSSQKDKRLTQECRKINNKRLRLPKLIQVKLKNIESSTTKLKQFNLEQKLTHEIHQTHSSF